MQRIRIVATDTPDGYTGYLKDNPGVTAKGSTHVELVQNIITALQEVPKKELEKEKK